MAKRFVAPKIHKGIKRRMPKNSVTEGVNDAQLSYESALQELETLVANMDSGQMPLDKLLASYQRGASLLKICRDKLAAVEQQIKRLDAQNSEQ
jgi:exodeoxyribonuclease VII small subunit